MRFRERNSFNAFILAAGFGERLKPLTDYIPKPLMPILGKPLIEIVLKRVAALNPSNIGINLHYKAEKILDYFKISPFCDKIRIFHEESILGTGGALKNAADFLKGRSFLVYNSDIFSDINLTMLLEHHLSHDNIATLAVHDYHEYNKLEVDSKQFLKNVVIRGNYNASSRIAFMGIAVYSPDFLNFLDDGHTSVVAGWMNAVSAGEKIYCMQFKEHSWSDIGSPETYASAVVSQLNSSGETVYIHSSAKVDPDIQFTGHFVVEHGTDIEGGTTFKNCILMPYSHIKQNLRYENSIVCSDFTIPLKESHFTGQKDKDDPIPIGYGGSNRKYYRIQKEDSSVVLMQTDRHDHDFKRHLKLTCFFSDLKIPVPRLIEADYSNFTAIFEDFGSVSLYTWLKVRRSEDEIEEIYKSVIDSLLLIHIDATRHIKECPEIGERVFDYEHFRWESSYFIEMFVKKVKNIDLKDTAPIYQELHRIALKADKFKKGVIHRDFQSQNIMIRYNKPPGIIDYQGARIAPPAYDIASLLYDPYYRFREGIRDRLLAYYMNKLSSETFLLKEEFLESLMICRLQRHMQALGAYGFLSNERGKKFFLRYIPEGIRLLKEDAVLLKDEYPELYKLTLKL